MAASYLPYLPDQDFLLPHSMREWLPEGHLAYFINDTVDSLDLRAFHARYAKDGPRNQPFHPAMMVKVLIYGYATGVFSSRKLARKLHEDVAVRVLGAGNFPAHRTLSDFRAFHLKELSELFVQVTRPRRTSPSWTSRPSWPDAKIGLTKSQRPRRGLEKRQRDADIQRGRDQDDDRKPRGKHGKPEGGRYKREFGVPEDKAQENFTDPDSRVMKRAGGGFDYSYNAQTAVDEMAHIIVAAELTNMAADSGELPVMLDAVRANLDADASQALADAGYRSEAVFEQLKDRPTELIVALGREGKQQVQIDARKNPCTAAMAAKMQSEKGQWAYRKRKWIAEPPNGWIKNVLGFSQFSMRGLHRVQAEFKLVCLALNLRRMSALQAG